MNAIPPRMDGAQAAEAARAKSSPPYGSAGMPDIDPVDQAFGAGQDTQDAALHAGPADAQSGHMPRLTVPAHLSAIEVTLSVEVGSQRIALSELLNVEPGQLFSLDRMTTEPVDILVNGRRFARGEVVAMGERYGVRITRLVETPGGRG